MHVFKKFHYNGEGAMPLPRPHCHHFFEKLNFISKILHFTTQIVVYQEGTEINTEVNERVLKIIDTH